SPPLYTLSLHDALPISTLIVILQVIASLQVFSQIYLLTTGGPDFVTRPVIQYIYETGFSSYRVGFASAASYVLFVLILVVTKSRSEEHTSELQSPYDLV